jgi:hypothetical protein
VDCNSATGGYGFAAAIQHTRHLQPSQHAKNPAKPRLTRQSTLLARRPDRSPLPISVIRRPNSPDPRAPRDQFPHPQSLRAFGISGFRDPHFANRSPFSTRGRAPCPALRVTLSVIRRPNSPCPAPPRDLRPHPPPLSRFGIRRIPWIARR